MENLKTTDGKTLWHPRKPQVPQLGGFLPPQVMRRRAGRSYSSMVARQEGGGIGYKNSCSAKLDTFSSTISFVLFFCEDQCGHLSKGFNTSTLQLRVQEAS